LLVEQNVELAIGVADVVYVMDKGRIVCSVTPTELMENEPMKETYLGLAAK
jgi:branched-chain amino acid transport system ATP-binding protein